MEFTINLTIFEYILIGLLVVCFPLHLWFVMGERNIRIKLDKSRESDLKYVMRRRQLYFTITAAVAVGLMLREPMEGFLRFLLLYSLFFSGISMATMALAYREAREKAKKAKTKQETSSES